MRGDPVFDLGGFPDQGLSFGDPFMSLTPGSCMTTDHTGQPISVNPSPEIASDWPLWVPGSNLRVPMKRISRLIGTHFLPPPPLTHTAHLLLRVVIASPDLHYFNKPPSWDCFPDVASMDLPHYSVSVSHSISPRLVVPLFPLRRYMISDSPEVDRKSTRLNSSHRR